MPDFIPPAKNSASPFADMRGHHVAVRTPSLREAMEFYVGKLDFRVVAEWDYGVGVGTSPANQGRSELTFEDPVAGCNPCGAARKCDPTRSGAPT